MSLRKLFTEHPAAVGETYFEHLAAAAGFAGWLLLATLACFVHAIFPFFCVTTGSSIIARLHDRMVTNRARVPLAQQTHPVVHTEQYETGRQFGFARRSPRPPGEGLGVRVERSQLRKAR